MNNEQSRDGRQKSRFRAEFQCPNCGGIIGINTWLALIQGPGLEMACKHCHQKYLITENGATPITKGVSDFDGIDSDGKPYKVPIPPPVKPKLPKGK